MTKLESTLLRSKPNVAAPAMGAALAEAGDRRPARVRRRRGPGRFGRYIVNRGWAHLILLSGVGLFLFPFVWMLTTSLKTDEELTRPGLLPTLPVFRAQSPYIRPAPVVARPQDVGDVPWEAALLRLRAVVDAQVRAHLAADGTLAPAQRQELIESAGAVLLNRSIARVNRTLWDAGPEAVLAVVTPMLSDEAIAAAVSDRTARLEMRAVQVRTLDARLHNLSGDAAAGRAEAGRAEAGWVVESGSATLDAAGVVRYQFDSPESQPIVLRRQFDFPGDPADLHKLIVSMQADDSWHGVDATLEVGGERWRSDRTTYLAQHRAMSIIFQPPTFDDQTLKAKTWVPLIREDVERGEVRREGVIPDDAPRPTPHAQPSPQPSPRRATLRLTLSPSSTLQAVYGKVKRNYERAFYSVPFWTYVWNSVLLVGLSVVGTLFSSTFVAYAFARLHWPGRSVAFVILLATMMLPGQVTMIPSFMIWRQVGWYNTLNPLWVPAWFGGAFFIFLMVQHMKTIPKELEESARIDGLNAVQTWWYIIVPLVKPAAAAIAIMTFMGAWNEFMGPLIYLRDQEKFPLSLGLFGMRVDTGGDWTMIMAGNMLMTLPVIVIFFLFQRYFIEGMTTSGMKG